jgi:aspartyl-tRNA(Asn)/glutamyl-tRNA(Gln) amidotransferase subunit A
MTPCTELTADRLVSAIRSGELDAVTATQAHLSAIAALNPVLAAYTDITAERALAKARSIDQIRARRGALPPLAGVPFAVKNLFDVAGYVTRAGSKINRSHPPATLDATAVARMEAAGAVLLGMLNMGEYAYDFTGRNAHDGASVNPHDRQRMSGGSSGGSATAAAAGLAMITLGSDTNGSIRVPASLCGLFGLKPTYGMLSRAGAFPFATSLDHIGALARSVRDLALAFDAMSGGDERDPVCCATAKTNTAALLETIVDARRIGIADDYFARGGQSEAAVTVIAKALGARRRVRLPEAQRARAAAYIITMIEGGSLHTARLRAQHRDFDPDVRDRLIAGAMLPAYWLVQAQKFRRWFQQEVLHLFRSFDIIVAPATPITAPLASEKTFALDGVELPVRANLGMFTQPISFIGLPVACVPTWDGALPIGVQIIAAPGCEHLALAVAHRLEIDGVCRAPVAPPGGRP